MSNQDGETEATALFRTLDGFLDHGDTYLLLQQIIEDAVAVFGFSDVAILLDGKDGLAVGTSTTADAKDFESWHLEHNETGPCLEAFRGQVFVACDDPQEATRRWPGWSAGAQDAGFLSAVAVPLVAMGESLGVLNLLGRRAGMTVDAEVARRFAQLAATVISLDGRRRSAEERSRQLQTALDARVLVEQAKGVLSERLGVSPADAFEQIRSAARSQRTRVAVIAEQIVASATG